MANEEVSSPTRGFPGQVMVETEVRMRDMNPRVLRRTFARALIGGVRIVWPILSALIGIVIVLGIAIGLIEGWAVHESLYFSLITGLTIGYGDLVPSTLATRTLAVIIGVCGLLLTALVAAIAVKALAAALDDDGAP
jgi:hypothetical protein